MNALGFMGFGEAAPAIAEGLAEAGARNLYTYDIAYEGSPDPSLRSQDGALRHQDDQRSGGAILPL